MTCNLSKTLLQAYSSDAIKSLTLQVMQWRHTGCQYFNTKSNELDFDWYN